ncbi:acyltransferase family protein [Janthinobacterium sp. SUN128]|uniref:acyltransferase family protein n=1 Tax=Janthinobacterium sp. SUN128 TaxID=3014790 RepID=UPI002712B604|nr:acyltransferase family protein [Janthinobacterium sp. SUN128]MDO8035555.1 acyltransferase family protein [Janthinobacterium sp. SUN128]
MMAYRREIDGLRTLAVLPVILFHAGFQIFSGGFVGVDVFFVISGYLITRIILAELEHGNFSIINFYERRARRILPALFFVLLVCLPLSWLWLVPDDMKNFSQSLLSVSVFSSNILFWLTSGYFDTAAELKPLLHTWSLAVEEQYYVFFPIFLIVMWRFGKRWILAMLIVIFFASLVAAQWTSTRMPMLGFFMLPTRGWELLIGAFVAFYMASDRRKILSDNVNQLLSMFGAALIVFAVFLFDKHTPFPSIFALVPTVGAALIILSANDRNLVGIILGNRFFVGIGLISYSAYLWHQPLFAFSRYVSFDEPSKIVVCGLIFLTFALAYISWRFIESPFRDRSRFSRRSIFIFSFLGTFFFAVFGLTGHVTKGFAGREIGIPFKPFEYDTTKLGYRKCDDPSLVVGETLNYCYQTTHGKVDAVLIGDSHADDKFYGLEKNSTELKWALVGNSSCPPLLNVSVEADEKGCAVKFEKIINWIKKSENIKTVVMSFYGNYPLTSAYAADHVRRNTGPDTVVIKNKEKSGWSRIDLFYYGLNRSVGELINSGKKVIVVVDVPELPFFPIDCVKGKSDCEISIKDVLARQAEHRKILDRLKKDFPMVNIFDPINIFCINGVCTYRSKEKILYRDSHHLTFDGSDIYGKNFFSWLNSLPE